MTKHDQQTQNFLTEDMIQFRRKCDDLSLKEVLQEWVVCESQKEQYPNADPTGWDEERLVHELKTTYDEPISYATFRDPDWTSLVISGSEIGKFDPYPSIGCNAFTGKRTLSGAIDRLQTENIADEYPNAVEKISRFRRMYPDHKFGAVVIRQYEEFWPPVTLDGNHRAWAAIWASRDGVDVELAVHIGHEKPIHELPLKKSQ